MARSAPDSPVAYGNASAIKAGERDQKLRLDLGAWPGDGQLLSGWQPSAGGFTRTITADEPRRPKAVDLAVDVHETILRFPSAPIHGLQRHDVHHHPLPSQAFHTFRLLRSADEAKRQPVSRYFLMHTGLNETYDMGLYYRLAAWLIKDDPSTVCVLRPFPGHFTRFPFEKYSESPLDRYLWDGSQLFRQFLRFMIETQWLLSSLVRRSSYRCASGVTLLAESDDKLQSRLSTPVLATAIHEAWTQLHASSVLDFERESANAPDRRSWIPPSYGRDCFDDAIAALRTALALESLESHDGEFTDTFSEPSFHVLGYSLGGFTAQSVFMAWPFLVASCSTLLAGGPLRDLAPSAFAHPEEWQTVLHSLRYELDDLLMTRGAGGAHGRHAEFGLQVGLFSVFKRAFYEVFQQEYKGSYQSRLEAFRHRMLFIVGGNDPVVTPRSVLDSAPEGGLNLLEIGGLGHFLGARPSDGGDQQSFWIPEVAALIDRFAVRSAEKHQVEQRLSWFDKDITYPAKPQSGRSQANVDLRRQSRDPGPRQSGAGGHRASEVMGPSRLTPAEVIAIDRAGALPTALFERCLDDLVSRIPEGGVLFILRNEIPTFLLPPFVVREVAAARYHGDAGIVRSCNGVAARWAFLVERASRVCIVLPWNARSLMDRMDRTREYPSQSETTGGRVNAPSPTADEVWIEVETRCRELARTHHGSVRRFDGRDPIATCLREQKDLLRLVRQDAHGIEHVAALPDCWVWVSKEFLGWKDTGVWGVNDAIEALGKQAPKVLTEKDRVLAAIHDNHFRIVTVSRARFNPRFRGRLLVTAADAKRMLIHAVLCIAMSTPLHHLGSEAFQ
jgi:hypothetical protein